MYKFEIRASLLSILNLIAVPAVLSLPHNVSVIHLPSNSDLPDGVFTNTSLLGGWPREPYRFTFNNKDFEIRLDSFGRTANDDLRKEVLSGIRGLQEYFVLQEIRKTSPAIHLDAGIVNFHIGFSGRGLWTGEEISQALAHVEDIYADEEADVVEITNAQVGISRTWVPLGAFQVLFSQLKDPDPSQPQ